ncbi:MAG: DUF4288 domain-containing protein [Coriobacteriia bacterium]|nr:DUF4288 domain-containing protein [Coriobacteriia bacterium]
MNWYAAHTVLFLEYTDGGPQDEYVMWENVYLVAADTDEQAQIRATEYARNDEDSDGSHGTVVEGRPARWVFAGIRKLIACVDSDSRPDDGTEVTYSTFSVQTQDELDAFVSGKPVQVSYLE